MTTRKSNIFLRILIILISLSMFGFQDVPVNVDPGPTMDQPVPHGYVELLIYGVVPTGVVTVTEDPVHFFLPITSIDSVGRSEFQALGFTYAHGKGPGPITVEIGFPVLWSIKGHVNLPPDCSIEMTIDEAWFPGFSETCEPTGIIGCLEDIWPPGFFPGVEFKIPFDRAWGSPVPGLAAPQGEPIPIHLTVIVESIAIGDLTGGIQPLGCESNLWFPVIPQAQ